MRFTLAYGTSTPSSSTHRIRLIFIISLQRWKRDKTLSFIPPDGKFVLAEYQYLSPQSTVVSNLPVPVTLKPNIAVGESGGACPLVFCILRSTHPLPGSFTVTFTSRMMKVMENVKIEWYLGEDASSAQCTLSGAGSGIGSIGGAEGSWTFDPRRKVNVLRLSCRLVGLSVFQVLQWDIPSMHSSGSWILRGSWTSK